MNKLKCRHCKDYFNREDGIRVPVGFFCSIEHAREHVKPKVQKLHVAYEKQKLAKRKVEIKPIRKVQAEAQTSINRYVRLRDAKEPCISCGKPHNQIVSEQGHKVGGAFDAGHFVSRGANKSLRYMLFNIHKQCKSCNGGSGNYSGKRATVDAQYRISLIEKIGIEKVEWLESDQQIRRQNNDREYLQRLKRIFNKKARILQKRLDNERVAA